MDNRNQDQPDPLKADTTGSDFTPATFDIDPADRELAERFSRFDPLATPSPVKLTGAGNFKAPERLTAGILPTEKRDAVLQQLSNVSGSQRAKREHQLVTETLEQNSVELRIRAGVGAGATQTERERFQLASEVDQLRREEIELETQLAEVLSWETVFDETGARVINPETGKQEVRANELVQGDRRKAMQAHLATLRTNIAELEGFGGDRRIQKAVKADVEAEKQRRQQLEEDREARKMADEKLRHERLEARSEAYAKNRRSVM